MIVFRCFRNDDPPRLAEVWRNAALGPTAVQPMTSALLETHVLARPFFDRAGLIVALDGGRAVGFGHAGFGTDESGSRLDRSVGTTMLLVTVPHESLDAIAAGLLARCEDYLRCRGARTIFGGSSPRLGGFYLGLYGGADVPGIPDSAPAMQAAFVRAGYAAEERIGVLRRPLGDFRPPVNRLQVAIQRSTRLVALDEPPRRTWWEAATRAGIALRRYVLASEAGETLGAATFWDMQPLAASRPAVTAGLLDVVIEGPRRREGLATYLVARALQDLAQCGVAVMETQVSGSNFAAASLFEKLGFTTFEHGTLYRLPETG